MKQISVLGIDLAKRSFQMHGMDSKGHKVLGKAMSPEKADTYIANLPPCTIGVEACGGAHFRARKYQAMGHTVKIIAPQFVKPFVQGNKNDPSDAEGIAEAANRPNIRCVPIKTEASQDLQNFHRIRERILANKVALTNQIRGILFEYGISIAQGDKQLRGMLVELAQDKNLSPVLQAQMADLAQELTEIIKRLDSLQLKLEEIAKETDPCQRLMEIGGIGPLIATALFACVTNASVFKNGRQMAAWLGLTPGHRQTGGPNGKKTMLGITKRGDTYLRKLLIQGARCFLIAVKNRVAQNKPLNKIAAWAYALMEKRGFNKAAVALANKNARIAWALLAKKETYKVAA